mmetsp:Transcript_16391/g.24797  ORF Transcript_16391/g.24797 Transcript_16391/m.24797 type:complete len:775 (-) Transcript_16391:231-2555(-)|eukprot:CAMPEP_0178931176 /NCGR_PEP_ID=MMETSP0786-20121207/21749_1 /TAXON_ID=186022 /ORGANISM="Thalassionema frauenfeldii, Strain CCMP 1798" /LENGTH=774 /DNA_ID=CAMNT_0020607993 /DNA_START=48 /DNA_END=2372 /DNA_ORIENTATION=+
MRLFSRSILAVILQQGLVVDAFTSIPLPYSHQVSCEVSSTRPIIQKRNEERTHRGIILMGTNGDDEKTKKNENETRNKISMDTIKEKLRMAQFKEEDSVGESNKNEEKDPLTSLKAFLSDATPSVLLSFFSNVSTKLVESRGIIFSFFGGVLLTGGLIFIPVLTAINTVSEPVALFETVLDEIDRSYVDEVDTNRLFETGVNAMLRSLDPYTEFEGKKEAVELTESIDGRYGGVGLVISGMTPKDLAKIKDEERRIVVKSASSNKLLPEEAVNERNELIDGTISDEDDEDEQDRRDEMKEIKKARENGIRVVQAFEGYAFDYGMRVGDKLVSINDFKITDDTSVEDVRNNLRGEPETSVDISFLREGVEGVQTITMPRTIVKIRDVKLATLIGNKADGIGYIQLSGFTQDAGREVRAAISSLRYQASAASGGEQSLKGLILDLRGNPGGLLNSAVDVAALFVPKDSDIVSARGRGFPSSIYRSRVDPFVDPSTKIAVLINEGTASAAEIVTGAIQDLDVGVVVGSDKTYGKGLVQNVEVLPFNTALKYTVAKYYTPSGRCIQGINYVEGGGLDAKDGRYRANKVAAEDRNVFFTSNGRQVKDGGGIEADYKVPAEKFTPLRVTLLRTGIISDFASQWSRNHELSNDFHVDDQTYKEFQAFVAQKQKEGDIKLEALYRSPLGDLEKMLKSSGYKESGKELRALEAGIIKEMQRDFEKDRAGIKEDLNQVILSRYLPQSMVLEQSLKTDDQVQAALKLVRNERQFKNLLARGIIDH